MGACGAQSKNLKAWLLSIAYMLPGEPTLNFVAMLGSLQRNKCIALQNNIALTVVSHPDIFLAQRVAMVPTLIMVWIGWTMTKDMLLITWWRAAARVIGRKVQRQLMSLETSSPGFTSIGQISIGRAFFT